MELQMDEKTILCIQCGSPFTITVAQQERIIALGFDEPKRCRECKNKGAKGGLSRYDEKMRQKNRDLKDQWGRFYNLRKLRNAIIVAGTGKKYRSGQGKGSVER
jgi:hypothetical protein